MNKAPRHPDRKNGYGMHGALSFKTTLIILFTSIGLFPLFASMALNLPMVMDTLETSLINQEIANIKEKYVAVQKEIVIRSESARLLSNMPGIRDIASRQTNNSVPLDIVHKRLSKTIHEWFDEKHDIKSITALDMTGKELFRMNRDGAGRLSMIPPGQLGFRQEIIDKLSTVDIQNPDIMVLGIKNIIMWNGSEHFHHPNITIGSPVYNYDGIIDGFATITMDIGKILENFRYDYIITGTGDYIYNGKSHHSRHTHAHGAAFADMPELKNILNNAKPASGHDNAGHDVVWVPIIPNNTVTQGLWSGSRVDCGIIDTLRHTLLQRIFFIVSIIIILVLGLTWHFSGIADRFRKELVQTLRGLIEKDIPVHLNWARPAEIQELGTEINRLSEQYLKIMAGRKDSQAKLVKLNRRFKMILENAAEGIVETDDMGNVRFANPAACSILGLDEDDLTGSDFHSIVHYLRKDRSQYPEEECPFCMAVKNGNYCLHIEDVFWHPNGKPVDVEYLTAPIYDDEHTLLGLVICIRDVSERKKAENRAADLQKQLLHSQKLEAVGTLAGGIAHDFNNLLTAITGYSELLTMDLAGNEEALKQIKYISMAARRAADLTKQLLTFSRKQQVEKRIVDVAEIVCNQEKILKRLISENIKFAVMADTDKPLNIMADPSMIEQVIMNIAVNARDAMPDGGSITISTEDLIITHEEVHMYKGGREGNFICISIKDTGSGIDKETMEQIFNPFFTTKAVDKGTGLGLSVVYGIIEQHGGWINVHSVPGRGTTFKIYIPEYCGEMKKESEAVGRKLFHSSDHPRKILILEDDVMVRDISKNILESHNINVTVADCIKTAKDIFNKHGDTFDLIISDVILPDGNGLNFIEWIQEQVPEMPAILTSGYIDESVSIIEIRKRNLPFIQKPFQIDEFVMAVEAAIKKRTYNEGKTVMS